MAVSLPTRRERILPRFIEEEMRESFIDYSMSVIVQRALPDARDGLKPVHRRILYAMWELGLEPARAHKKSAAVVGDVLGKYHPHGDSAVYEALVRMAQDFSLRYPLVDGQGNFGSIDGDPAAAYRYTEARLTPLAVELLRDLDKDTVDFRPNFDERLFEPEALPASCPQLLVNGSDGIAVGMATRIPPHNLNEITAAADALLARPNLSLDKLIERVEGPDFPTGGLLCGREGIEQAYRTGRGRLVMRGRMHVEPGLYGKTTLVVTELPYQTTKSRIVEQIAGLARAGQLEGLSDIRDESDRDGVRVVIELKRDTDPKKLAAQLYKKTQLESTFGVITLALVDGVPRELNLKEALEAWIRHRLQVVVRRARFEHTAARDRAHILEGLLKALARIDEVVAILKGSRTPEAAAQKLRKTLRISAAQADAILAMRLARLTSLEHKKLSDERAALKRRLKELESLLESEDLQRKFIRKELAELAQRFGDTRRTEILDDGAKFPIPTLGAEEEFQIFTTWLGYVKAMPVRSARRADERSAAEVLEQREGDLVTDAFLCRSDDALLAFTADGTVHAVRAKDLPRGTRASRGRPLAQILELGSRVEIVAVFPMGASAGERFVVTLTLKGKIKRTSLSEYRNVRAGGILGCKVERGDAIVAAGVTDGSADLVIVTASGQAIRFAESEVRAMGRAAAGVRAIALGRKDTVVGFAAASRDSVLAVGTERGLVRRIRAAEMRRQSRGGRGVSVLSGEREPGAVVGVVELRPGDRVSAITAMGATLVLDDAAESAEAGLRKGGPRLGKDDALVALARSAAG
ncbi:MAG: DNA gyrase subunit A [Gemmatimonadota bacterium]